MLLFILGISTDHLIIPTAQIIISLFFSYSVSCSICTRVWEPAVVSVTRSNLQTATPTRSIVSSSISPSSSSSLSSCSLSFRVKKTHLFQTNCLNTKNSKSGKESMFISRVLPHNQVVRARKSFFVDFSV